MKREWTERIESGGQISGHAGRRSVWPARYVDELILRQRATSSPKDGTLDEVLHAMQDANCNAVTLADTGDVVERLTYDTRGKVSFRNGSNLAIRGNGHYANSAHAWEYLYTGRRLDRESGLMYYRKRCYQKVFGRFVPRDPIGYDVTIAGEGRCCCPCPVRRSR